MKVQKIVLTATLVGVLSIASLATTAFAWHPKGTITKQVQNLTSGSTLSAASSADSAVTAKPGDTLKYEVVVSNTGAAASNGDDDMAHTVMTDTLPTGVELTSNPSQRQITENMGTIKPGQNVTKDYIVTVTATTDTIIENTACFTGNSLANDNPQQGCSSTFVSVTVPTPPVVTPTTPTPTTPTAPTTPTVTPTELPHTGMTENFVITAIALGIITYVTYIYVVSRRELSERL